MDFLLCMVLAHTIQSHKAFDSTWYFKSKITKQLLMDGCEMAAVTAVNAPKYAWTFLFPNEYSTCQWKKKQPKMKGNKDVFKF